MIRIIMKAYSFNLHGLPTGRRMGSVMNFGNMLSRTDNTRNLTETFSYDNLDRLVSSSGNTADTRTFIVITVPEHPAERRDEMYGPQRLFIHQALH